MPIDTRSPTAEMRPQSDVDQSTATTLKRIGVAFAMLMLATTFAFGLAPGASAITALAVMAALAVAYVSTQPIIDWVATNRS